MSNGEILPWAGLSCFLGAAAFYFLGRWNESDAEVLKSVKRVKTLKDLAQLLGTASNRLSSVVTVSGRVGADLPISCKYSGLRGVIVEEKAEQYFMKQDATGSWYKDSELMSSTCEEVPWYLNDGTGRVYVAGARGASGFSLTYGGEVYKESGTTLNVVCGPVEKPQGLQMLGVTKKERVLPTGTRLTVVGEAVKDDIGRVVIQKPHNGPFYVSYKTIDQLIESLGIDGRFVSVAFTVIGVWLTAKIVTNHL